MKPTREQCLALVSEITGSNKFRHLDEDDVVELVLHAHADGQRDMQKRALAKADESPDYHCACHFKINSLEIEE